MSYTTSQLATAALQHLGVMDATELADASNGTTVYVPCGTVAPT